MHPQRPYTLAPAGRSVMLEKWWKRGERVRHVAPRSRSSPQRLTYLAPRPCSVLSFSSDYQTSARGGHRLSQPLNSANQLWWDQSRAQIAVTSSQARRAHLLRHKLSSSLSNHHESTPSPPRIFSAAAALLSPRSYLHFSSYPPLSCLRFHSSSSESVEAWPSRIEEELHRSSTMVTFRLFAHWLPDLLTIYGSTPKLPFFAA